jgi:hypothetical protein
MGFIKLFNPLVSKSVYIFAENPASIDMINAVVLGKIEPQMENLVLP